MVTMSIIIVFSFTRPGELSHFAMERSTMLWKWVFIHYVYGHFQLQTVSSPEGI